MTDATPEFLAQLAANRAAKRATMPLDQVKALAMGVVARRDTAVRRPFITEAPGKDSEYREKESEARAIKADIAASRIPNPADYPWAASEVGINGPDLEAVADLYLTNADLWRPIGILLNQIKQQARVAIDAATTPDAVESAKQTALTALNAIT